MNYRAVGNRIAVNLDQMRLPISDHQALAILKQKGFRKTEVDLISEARSCVGKSSYKRGSRIGEAPGIVDCSSFIKWIYGRKGIWLPRRSIQQREIGQTVELSEIAAGDLIFTSGKIDYYHNDPAGSVGHVGSAAADRSVVHAANKKSGVIESPLCSFVCATKFHGAMRYVPANKKVLRFEVPQRRDVEISDDLRWIILQSLP